MNDAYTEKQDKPGEDIKQAVTVVKDAFPGKSFILFVFHEDEAGIRLACNVSDTGLHMALDALAMVVQQRSLARDAAAYEATKSEKPN